jgi:hypothetical protein
MDAVAVSGHLLPSGSVYAFLAEHRRELFPDAMFPDLFPSERVLTDQLGAAGWRGSSGG